MATITKRRNRFTICFTSFDGTRRELYGFTNERLAQRLGTKLDDLVAAHKMGTIPEELKIWLPKLDPNICVKLAQWGLCDPPEKRWTFGDLTESFLKSKHSDSVNSLVQLKRVQVNLHTYFTASRDLATITPVDAKEFEAWFRTEPLNRGGVPYSEATVLRRIGTVKQIFQYAVEFGMLPTSPMTCLKGGDSVNPSRWHYISVDDCVRVIKKTSYLKTRVTIALIRFCGLRGTSDMIKLTWSDIAWSHDGTPCRILAHGQRTFATGRAPAGFSPSTPSWSGH